jgi:phosphatidylcholine synthase
MLIFLLMVFKLPEWITLAIIIAAAILTFAPVEFIHPIRVQRLRPLTLAMTFLWGALAIWAVADDLSPGPAAMAGLAVTSIYLGGIGAFLQYTRKRA